MVLKDIFLFNTLSGTKDKFASMKSGEVKMYNCGPTLYGRQHIGNLSMFVFTDILRRTLEWNGYKIDQVINFTDFGHLTGDNEGNPDIGEDKMTKGLVEAGLPLTIPNMRVLAEKYAKIFLEDLALLNVDPSKVTFPFASDYIKEQIEIVDTLLKKDFAYDTPDGVYFDTSTFGHYGELGKIDLSGQKDGARIERGSKKGSHDFILWKKDPKKGWASPWGMGFPGWHIECTAMVFSLLGKQIDIHTGGIEHIAIHHNNEIAQAESASGLRPFSGYWLHREHIRINSTKISKSLGNVAYVSNLVESGIHPISYRYFLLTAHYSTPANFTQETLINCQNTLEKILVAYHSAPSDGAYDEKLVDDFQRSINDNLDTPKALTILHRAVDFGSNRATYAEMDKVLGLSIDTLSAKLFEISEEAHVLKQKRDRARADKNFEDADALRNPLESLDYLVADREGGTVVRRRLAKII